VRLAASHRLGEHKDGGPCTRSAQVPECPINEGFHPHSEVVLIKELTANNLFFEQCIKVENRGATVCGKY
jgi:hypothetical protein